MGGSNEHLGRLEEELFNSHEWITKIYDNILDLCLIDLADLARRDLFPINGT